MRRKKKPENPNFDTVYIRIRKGLKERLERVVEELNRRHSGARFTKNSVASVAIEEKIEQLEKELGIQYHEQ